MVAPAPLDRSDRMLLYRVYSAQICEHARRMGYSEGDLGFVEHVIRTYGNIISSVSHPYDNDWVTPHLEERAVSALRHLDMYSFALRHRPDFLVREAAQRSTTASVPGPRLDAHVERLFARASECWRTEA